MKCLLVLSLFVMGSTVNADDGMLDSQKIYNLMITIQKMAPSTCEVIYTETILNAEERSVNLSTEVSCEKKVLLRHSEDTFDFLVNKDAPKSAVSMAGALNLVGCKVSSRSTEISKIEICKFKK